MFELPDSATPFFRSRDLDEVRDRIARRYCPHGLVKQGLGGQLDAAFHDLLALPGSSLHYLRYGAAVHITPVEFGSFFLVETPVSGGMQGRAGKRAMATQPGKAAVVSPTLQTDSYWSADCAQLMVRIDRAALENRVAALIGRPLDRTLEFELSLDLSRGMGPAFSRFLDYLVVSVSGDRELAQSVLIAANLEETLLNMLVLGQPHTFWNSLQARVHSASPKHVAKTLEFMVAHAHEPMTAEILTKVSGVSSRSFYEGFQKFKGCSPMASLRAIRLERVRRELLAAQPGTSVASVARKWGFAHLGRFARTYQAVFGEKPSQTLRR